MKGNEYLSDFARKYYAHGFSDGLAAGRAEGLGRALLMTLQGRGIEVPETTRAVLLT
ncbi:MAG: hypothetical protein ABJE95_10970 [Byssovorax sp.]